MSSVLGPLLLSVKFVKNTMRIQYGVKFVKMKCASRLMLLSRARAGGAGHLGQCAWYLPVSVKAHLSDAPHLVYLTILPTNCARFRHRSQRSPRKQSR
jgi:hypothetical protein